MLKKTRRRSILIGAALALCSLSVSSQPRQADNQVLPRDTVQRLSLRNNLLYDAALTPNLGLEYVLGRHWSIGGNVGFRPWPTDDNTSKKWKHLLVAPELRHWNDSIYKHKSSFWGLNLIWSHYNVAEVKFPFGMYKAVRDGRREGDLLALGIFYGYNWRLNRHFRLEAEVGVGAGYAWGKEYDCGHCGTYRGDYDGPFVVPKLALNIVYNKMKPAQPLPVDTFQLMPPPPAPVLAFGALVPATVSDLLNDYINDNSEATERIYFDRVPDAKAETINRAIALMQQQNYADAQPLLLSVKEDPRSWNALGVALYMNGEQTRALEYFRKAADNGNKDAQTNIDGINRYLETLRLVEQHNQR